MWRRRVSVVVVPLVMAAGLARTALSEPDQPCIVLQSATVRLSTNPWQSAFRVAFTDDASAASIRVQIVDDPTVADFALADDGPVAAWDTCGGTGMIRYVSIATEPRSGDPIVFLTHTGNADYRIYANSKSVTARHAAALLIGATRDPRHIALASK